MNDRKFECKLYDNIELESSIHHEVNIIYIMAGSGYIKIGEKERKLEENDFYIINVDESYSFRKKKNVLYAILSIYMDQVGNYVDMSNLTFAEGVAKKVPDEIKRKVKRNLVRIIRTELDKGIYTEILLNGYSQELLYYLVKYFAVNINEVFLKEYDEKERRKRQINQYIYTHFREPLSLHDLAGYLHLSDAYLSKYMRKTIGQNFLNYLMNIRVEHAEKDLVSDDDRTILSVALDNGFSNINSFNKTFQNKYGMTPTLYRKTIKRAPAEPLEVRSKEMRKILQQNMEILSAAEESKPEELLEKNTQMAIGNTEKKLSYSNHWNKCINVGRAIDLLQADVQEHILYLKKNLGIQSVRCWNFFSNDMIYRVGNGRENYQYNFSQLDKVLDFLVRNELKPFIQLVFKPNLIIRNLDENVYFKDEDIMFENLEQYIDFIGQWMKHLILRFGTHEINTWMFEVWRSRFIEKGMEAYYRLFESTYMQIKKYASRAQVGGMGFELIRSESMLISEIRSWSQRKIRPDFITAYVYPYNVNGNNIIVDGRRIQNENYVLEWIDKLKRILHENNMELPLRITEWNISISSRNVLHDSVFMASYIVKNILSTLNQVDFMAYWSATDIVSEHFDTESVLYGGEGILSQNGIRKPSYYAFWFLNQLEQYILGKGENYIITGNDKGEYAILCYNYQHPDILYYKGNENIQNVDQICKLFEDGKKIREKICIENVENGIYRKEIRRVNSSLGSVQDEIIRGGFLSDTNNDEIRYLKEVCVPGVFRSRIECRDNRVEIETDLDVNEIQLIKITK